MRSRIAVAALAAVALVSLADAAGARLLRKVCADGDHRCDTDGACDDRCTFAFCRVLCLVPPCPDIFGPCLRPDAELLVDVPLRRGGKAPGRRRVSLGRGVRTALRCVPPRAGSCKPALATGCRSELPPAECAAHDGEHARRGLAPVPACHCRTEDAGTPCQRDGDCQGLCLAELGGDGVARCSAYLVEFGCFLLRDDEGEAHAICID